MDIQVLLASAEAALKAGQLEQAEGFYRQAVAARPEVPEIHYQLANVLLSQGRKEAAVEIYQAVLRLSPDHLKTLNNLGNLLFELARFSEAVDCFQKALTLQPNYSRARENLVIALGQLCEKTSTNLSLRVELGSALHLLGRLEESESVLRSAVRLCPESFEAKQRLAEVLCERAATRSTAAEAAIRYREALQLQPDFMAARQGLAAIAEGGHQRQSKVQVELLELAMKSLQAGELTCAEELYREALKADREQSFAWHQLGVILYQTERQTQGIEHIREAIRLRPDFVDAHYNLATIFHEQQKLDEAVDCYRRALELKPDYELVYYSLGNVYREQQKLDEAVACYRRALELKPDYAAAHNNLGITLQDQQKLDEAIACYRRALELKPDFTEAHVNLGTALIWNQQLEEATTSYRRALELQPDFAKAHHYLGIASLLSGDYERGWPEYEWRWRSKEFKRRTIPKPHWDGGDIKGRTILIHAEQGLGDSLQFVRYLPVVQARGGRVIFECQAALEKICERLNGYDELAVRGKTLPAFDEHAPLMSLPLLLNLPQPADSPKPPYLSAEPRLIAHWKNRLDELTGFKVGINWQGNPKYRSDWKRSIRLSEFSPLAKIPGVNLVSLQQGYGSEQLNEWADRSAMTDLGPDVDKDAGAFTDTAAIVQNLDLVITIDSALEHLAGAMGRPVWVALSAVPDWRWGLRGESTDWYPSMRLYRQTKMGQWSDVFERMADDLRRLVSEKNEG